MIEKMTNNEKSASEGKTRLTILVVFESAMAILYLVLGILFLLTKFGGFLGDRKIAFGLGVVLTVYGVFRVYRAIKKLR